MERIALNETSPMAELRGVICHVGSHSVTCCPTQVNAPHLGACATCSVYDDYVDCHVYAITSKLTSNINKFNR